MLFKILFRIAFMAIADLKTSFRKHYEIEIQYGTTSYPVAELGRATGVVNYSALLIVRDQ